MLLRDSNLGIGAGPGLTLTLLTESSDDIKQRLDKLLTNINEQDSRLAGFRATCKRRFN